MSQSSVSTRRSSRLRRGNDSSEIADGGSSILDPTSPVRHANGSSSQRSSSPLQMMPPLHSSENRTNERATNGERRKAKHAAALSDASSPLKYAPSTPRSKSGADWSRSSVDGENRQGGKTPRRFRPDLNSAIDLVRTVRLEDEGVDESFTRNASITSDVPRPGTRVFIWGTRICVTDVQEAFRKFLTEFRNPHLEDDELLLPRLEADDIDRTRPYYLQRLQEICLTTDPQMNINLQHIKIFDEVLYRQIVCYPADIIPYLDFVANSLFEENFDCMQLPYQIQIRPFNADRTRNMRDLNPEDIDQLITIHGMVIRTSALIPEMRSGFFECSICRNTTTVDVDRGRVEEPTFCQNCNVNHTFKLIHNRCLFADKQVIKLQESPDDMPAGQTPYTVTLYAHGDLVDTIEPGDRVTVTGIYRAVSLRTNPKQRVVRSVFKTYIDVLHVRKTDVHRLRTADDGSRLSEERVTQIIELSRKSDIYDRLAHGLAPSIYEHDDIKKGILCLLFGGSDESLNSTNTRCRSNINVLLCGDPGTSKSQLLRYVHGLVPRGQYTSGKGSSAGGLTAYVTRDNETKHFVLQTGALVLSDNGVCCIDEFDKMNDGTRSVLHEVMEQQTVSIAKAGIICQLNARTSILAAANPVDSQWNKDKTIIENVQLPHTLLSRFDLIFLLLDPQDEYYDRRLAAHLVSLYYKTGEDDDVQEMDTALLRDYISYAKMNCRPKLSKVASQNLCEKYVKMRQVGKGVGQVSAYPRQLESLIRLAEAHAKIRLSATVDEADVEEAYRLHREALKQSAVDPLTGKVDVNILASGVSAATRKHVLELAEVIKNAMAAKAVGSWFFVKKLLMDIRERSDRMITRELMDEAVNELCKNNVILRGREGQVRLIQPVVTRSVNDDIN